VSSVLVVEDSEPLARLLTQTLARAGHHSAWAASGSEACDHAAATPPDVVLIDMHLGDMTGTELAAALRTTVPAARLIGVSGETPNASVVSQFDAFLLKPVGLDTLLSAVTGQ
jgi:DNA-binding response OmpR family regulator